MLTHCYYTFIYQLSILLIGIMKKYKTPKVQLLAISNVIEMNDDAYISVYGGVVADASVLVTNGGAVPPGKTCVCQCGIPPVS